MIESPRTDIGKHYAKMAGGGPENIVITGPRCSGKTTLAVAMFRHLAESGVRVHLIGQRGRLDDIDRRRPGECVPQMVIWDRDDLPPNVTNSPLPRYITCGAIL